MRRLLQPPRLRPAEEGDIERHATWFELFFDLVFALAITQLSHMVQQDASLTGMVRFVGLFVPVWWSWVIYTFYADRFDTDDVIYRFMVMLGMLGITAVATTLPRAFSTDAAAFVGCYLLVRVIPFLLYVRAARYVPLARRLASGYGTGSLLAALCWLGALFLAGTPRLLLWGCAVLIELATPLVLRRNVEQTPLSASHIVERFGAFTIIVLGEL